MTRGALRQSLADFCRSKTDMRPDLRDLVDNIASACWAVSRAVGSAALNQVSGLAGTVNVQGEDQKPLDLLAQAEFERNCGLNRALAAMVSEELDTVTWLKPAKAGDYVLYFDPLDGSSNLDVNLSVGSIFAVGQIGADGSDNLLLPGRDLVLAGYAIYGPSTMLVICDGTRVDGFTLDPNLDDFVLTHPMMTIPPESVEFAINAARAAHWSAPIKSYIAECVAGVNGPRGRVFNMRWTASMVADMHRILTRGGVFLYPSDADNHSRGGRLRLMYEANPMAMIAEVANGLATDGTTRLLDLVPTDIHQRVGVVIGSRTEVAHIAQLHRAP